MHTMRAALRSTKDFVNNYSAAEAKVRQATSNDPWGAPASLMQELAESSHNSVELKEIIDMIFKRMNDHGKNWRHVSKALNLLDYLIKNGSDHVVDEARRRLHEVRTLKEFQYIDEDGKDQGINIRVKSKELTQLIQDDELIKKEREKALQVRTRLGRVNQTSTEAYRDRPYDPNSTTSTRREYEDTSPYRDDYSYTLSERQRASQGMPNSALEEEDHDYKSALEESRRQYEREEELRRASQEQLQRALERSKIDEQPVRKPEPTVDLFSQGPSAVATNSFGAPAIAPPPGESSRRQRRHDRAAQAGTMASDSFDSGDITADYEFMPRKTTMPAPASKPQDRTFDPFTGTPSTTTTAASSNFDPFLSTAAPPTTRTTATLDPFGAPMSRDPFSTSTTSSSSATTARPPGSSFDAAFDGGKEAKKLPHQLAGKSDPNAMLAEIARNATKIDEFAQLGESRLRSTSFNAPTASAHATTPSLPIPSKAPSSTLAAPTPANSFNPSSSYGASSTSSFSPPATFGAPTPANSYNPPSGFGAFGPNGPSMMAGASIYQPVPMQAAPAANPFNGGSGFGTTAPAQAAVFDPFAALAPVPAAMPASTVPMQPTTFGGASTMTDPFGNMVNLSAEGLATNTSSKNPFGSTARKFDWGDQPKPQMSLNDIKKQQTSGSQPF